MLRAFPLVALVRGALWLLPFKLVARLVRRLQARGSSATRDTPSDIAWAIRAASRRVPAATCLTQAFAGSVLLSRAGHRYALRIGARRHAERGFEAHAWVEHEGEIILGQTEDLSHFVPLMSFPDFPDKSPTKGAQR